jgi:hypothetical protein
MAEQLLTVYKKYRVAHTVHDELVCVVPEGEADACLAFMLDVMRKPPAWWPELVLWAEGSYGDTYGESK